MGSLGPGLEIMYSSITLVDPFYGGSSYTTKFEFESFETQFCFSNSPDVVPIVFIFVEKSSEKILRLKNEKSEKISSHPSLSSVGLWYSNRPARTHEERVFYGFKNNPLEPEIFAKYWWKTDRKMTEKGKFLKMYCIVFKTVKNSFLVSSSRSFWIP